MQQDPLVENLAQIGSLDQEYLGLMSLVENRTPPRDLPGQCSAVDRFLGRSVISYIPNSFNNTFVWQDAIRKRAEVRERRVKKPTRGSKESFTIGQQVLLQDHVSKKWDIPGEITNVRLAPDNKILSYEIL